MFDFSLNKVFNVGMIRDEEIIQTLGGPTRLANLLGLKKRGSVQRVQNWIKRGIPSKVKLDRPDIFLRKEFFDIPKKSSNTNA